MHMNEGQRISNIFQGTHKFYGSMIIKLLSITGWKKAMLLKFTEKGRLAHNKEQNRYAGQKFQ